MNNKSADELLKKGEKDKRCSSIFFESYSVGAKKEKKGDYQTQKNLKKKGGKGINLQWNIPRLQTVPYLWGKRE